jgi:hypothetical protein
MWPQRTISGLGLSVDAPLRIALVVSPCEWPRAAEDWTQADKGANTDEAHGGYGRLEGDPSMANTSHGLPGGRFRA